MYITTYVRNVYMCVFDMYICMKYICTTYEFVFSYKHIPG